MKMSESRSGGSGKKEKKSKTFLSSSLQFSDYQLNLRSSISQPVELLTYMTHDLFSLNVTTGMLTGILFPVLARTKCKTGNKMEMD